MKSVETISASGEYEPATIVGDDPSDGVGLEIKLHPNAEARIEYLDISNVFIGLIHYSGTIFIDELHIHGFGGDAINLRTGNFHVGRLHVHDNIQTRDYNEYHQDALQAYAVLEDGYTLDNTGEISNVTIDEVIIHMDGASCQGIIGSENCTYSNWNIGLTKLDIQVGHYYSMMFTNLLTSRLGGKSVNVSKPIRIRDVKDGGVPTSNVTLVGLNNKRNDFNPSSRQVRATILV